LRKHFAENLLALFTARDVSASIVGDLLEEAHGRRRAWFAFEIVRLAFALCFASLFAAPLRALRLAVVGLVVYAGTYSVLFVASGLPWHPWHRVHEVGFLARGALVVFTANLVTGAVLARLPTGGGSSALAPIAALWLKAWVVWPFLLSLPYGWPSGSAWYGITFALLFPVLCLLPLFLGAMLAQRRIVTPT
jgi:hypothetical protein